MYVPVIKNRQEEFTALKNLLKIPISNKILPLIEVVHENIRNKNLLDQINSLNCSNFPIMIDIPIIFNPISTTPEIKNFLIKYSRNIDERVTLLNTLNKLNNIIPVISYDINNYMTGSLSTEENKLRSNFSKIAFRIKIKYIDKALNEITKLLKNDDIVILDIDNLNNNNSSLTDYYNKINSIKDKHKITTIIINSVIPKDLTNKGLDNGLPIVEADNSLRDNYIKYGFNAFGDYATIKSELPHLGGTISPGFIFYSWHSNSYIGFNSIVKSLDEFKKNIIPSVVKSTYWSKYSKSHKENCPGCQKILNVLNNIDSGKSQALWKRVSIMHYIYTMNELL